MIFGVLHGRLVLWLIRYKKVILQWTKHKYIKIYSYHHFWFIVIHILHENKELSINHINNQTCDNYIISIMHFDELSLEHLSYAFAIRPQTSFVSPQSYTWNICRRSTNFSHLEVHKMLFRVSTFLWFLPEVMMIELQIHYGRPTRVPCCHCLIVTQLFPNIPLNRRFMSIACVSWDVGESRSPPTET